ncbi:MAG: AAA family ATPase [Anaerolineales bacterium]|nr:AAA family ATPase [Anaerolineales bacterium]
MKKPLLVIVTGLPGTGKTAMARRLAQRFDLPLIHKDGYKEILFDAFGWSDPEWSHQLSKASFQIQFHTLEILLKASVSCLAEGNFDARQASPEFQKLQARQPHQVLQIVCVTDGPVLWQRFLKRAGAQHRHPGHTESGGPERFREMLLAGRSPSLDLEGMIMEVDTTDFAQVNYPSLYQAIRQRLTWQDPEED